MFRAGQNAHKTRHFAEKLPLPLLFSGAAVIRQDPSCCFADDGDHAGRLAALVEHGRVVEIFCRKKSAGVFEPP
jgi:hypothetical protein